MIYVDNPIYKLGRMNMCHMVSDTSIDQLHEMADKIGVDRKHFQKKSRPHYDVCKAKRALAISHGAKPVSGREVIRALHRLAETVTV